MTDLSPVLEELLDMVADRVAAKLRQDSQPDVLTVRQAAHKAQVSEEQIRRWVRAGILPRVPGSRTHRIPRYALEELLHAEAR